ncbi:MAG: PorV/PorQ family protein [Candidatus Cloacimonadaceae bacterium]
MFRFNFKVLALSALILILMIIPLAINAISQGTMTFLTIEPGSRANGMGNAYVAVADDGYAGWWNPAATAFNRKTQFAGMHTNWLQGSGINDLFYEYLGWNQYFENIGSLGLNVVWMEYGDQEQTDEDNNNLGIFSSNEFAVSAIYASEIVKNKIGLGLGFKFLYSNLGPGTEDSNEKGKAMSYAFDVSSKFKDILTPRLDFGVVIQNIGPNVTYLNDSDSDPLCMMLRVGAAYRVFDSISDPEHPGLFISPGSFKQKLTLSADMANELANEDPLLQRFVTSWDGEEIFSAGAEYNYLDIISLRGGYFYDHAGHITGPCFGAGFHYTFSHKYRIFADFAMPTGGELTDYNKTFSLGLEF